MKRGAASSHKSTAFNIKNYVKPGLPEEDVQ